MNRRDALSASGALALALLGTKALAAEAGHAHHDHSMHHDHGAGSGNQSLVDTAAKCVSTGQTCLAHCLVLLGDGDKAMAECAKAVSQMMAACGALQSLAAQGSRLTRQMAAVALEACTECEKACRKHADKHAECKACMESCGECIKACKAVA